MIANLALGRTVLTPPSGQRGWYSWAQVGAGITTPAAASGSSAFVFYTT